MSSTELRALDSLISSPVKRNAPKIGEWCLRVGWKGSSDPEDSGPRGAGGPTHSLQDNPGAGRSSASRVSLLARGLTRLSSRGS